MRRGDPTPTAGDWSVKKCERASRLASPESLDIRYENERHWVAGDRGASEWTIKGTDTSGAQVEIRGCDLFEFREGKIARKDS